MRRRLRKRSPSQRQELAPHHLFPMLRVSEWLEARKAFLGLTASFNYDDHNQADTATRAFLEPRRGSMHHSEEVELRSTWSRAHSP